MIYIAGLLVSIIAKAENRVAVIDTGINVNDKNRPYLCKEGHEDFTGYGLQDEEGHGTKVVDVLINTTTHKNYCIVVLKFWQKHMSTQQTIQATVNAFYKARDLNVAFVNYSATGNTPSKDEEWIIKSSPKITFVVAAGNDNINLDVSPRYPASYKFSNVFVVGALNIFGTKHHVSNYGSVVKYWEVGTATSFSTPVKTGKLINERFAR